MENDIIIQKRVKEILLQEPSLQYPSQIIQFCWRYFEVVGNKSQFLPFISKSQFIDWQAKYGTIESIVRARRKVLKELGNKDLGRYEQANRHRNTYKEKDLSNPEQLSKLVL